MIFISHEAKEKVQQLQAESSTGDDFFIRISVVGGGCSGLSYNIDFDSISQENDQVFEDKGVKLVTDLKSFLYLCDSTLHFTGGLNGKGFHFENPNASRSCACGDSFSV